MFAKTKRSLAVLLRMALIVSMLGCLTMAVSAQGAPTGEIRTYTMPKGAGEFKMYIPKACLTMSSIPMVVLLGDNGTNAATVETELSSSGLAKVADDNNFLVSIAFPQNGTAWTQQDISYLKALNDALVDNKVIGNVIFPNTHLTLRYMAGNGAGADIATAFFAKYPVYTAGVLLFNPSLADYALPAGVPAWIVNGSIGLIGAYAKADGINAVPEKAAGVTKIFSNPTDAAMQIRVSSTSASGYDKDLVAQAYTSMFAKTRRWPTTNSGVITDKKTVTEMGFVVHKADRSLGDNNGMEHEWYESVPASNDGSKALPLVVVCHGAGTDPVYCAEQTRWHEIGQANGFITVYPFACNRVAWNSDLDATKPSDNDYLMALIAHLKKTYKIDTSRIYFAGFSSGSLMAQTMGMVHPDMVAAIAPFSLFEQNATFNVPGKANTLYDTAMQIKADYKARGVELIVPVWHVIGTKDPYPGYPAREGNNAQRNIDFWKTYNNIPVKPITDLSAANLVGVPGDKIVKTVFSYSEYPDGRFTTNSYYSGNDPRKNYLNLTIVQDLPHACDLNETPQAWDFISRFSRNADGNLTDGRYLDAKGITEKGVSRSYYEYLPKDYIASAPINYVTVPDGVNVDEFAASSGWKKVADSNNIVVSFLTPQAGGWNPANPDADIAYINAVINAPQGKYNLHSSRKYLVGYAEGSTIAQMYAFKYPSIFAGVAAVDGFEIPTSFLHNVGTEDIVAKRLDGTTVTDTKANIPMAAWLISTKTIIDNDVVDYWKKANAVAPEGKATGNTKVFANVDNPNQRVIITEDSTIRYDYSLASKLWTIFLSKVRRYKSDSFGALTEGMTAAQMGLVKYDDSKFNTTNNACYIYIPSSYNGGKSVPLVLATHGVNNYGEMFAEQTEWYKLAEQNGFIAVFPTGYSTNTTYPSWSSTVTAVRDDEKYLCNLIADIKANFRIDASRVYMTGFSNGGGMANAMALKYPGTFAAVVSFAGVTTSTAGLASPTLPMPVYFFAGDMDGACTFNKSYDVREYWRNVDGISTTFDAKAMNPPADLTTDRGELTTTVFKGKAAEIRFSLIRNMPHATRPSTIAEGWKFLARFSRNADGSITDTVK
jgi:poly(3-hydroxybutyrate) depolymerase